jgi:hypothetical protein
MLNDLWSCLRTEAVPKLGTSHDVSGLVIWGCERIFASESDIYDLTVAK